MVSKKQNTNLKKSGHYDAQTMITLILFAPVDPDVAQFQKIISVR
jgi:hypothetical protein